MASKALCRYSTGTNCSLFAWWAVVVTNMSKL